MTNEESQALASIYGADYLTEVAATNPATFAGDLTFSDILGKVFEIYQSEQQDAAQVERARAATEAARADFLTRATQSRSTLFLLGGLAIAGALVLARK